ncbi:MAG TPA: hypothetical protein VL475_04110 [Planctomycetaceae bacterium]|nr:hypothetical protein [Planctomycetaceae bacterium]
MTKFSRSLTIFVTVLAVAFMGVAAVTTATSTDWKEAATKKFPKARISEQQEQIRKLDEGISATENALKLALAGIAADVKALSDPETGRESELEKQLAGTEQRARELAQQIEAQARKADAKLEELQLRREDTVRLENQFAELQSQKVATQAEVKRLGDLLFQAKGMLDRVRRRRESLEAQMRGAPNPGEPADAAANNQS